MSQRVRLVRRQERRLTPPTITLPTSHTMTRFSRWRGGILATSLSAATPGSAPTLVDTVPFKNNGAEPEANISTGQ